MDRQQFCERLTELKGDLPILQLSYKCQIDGRVLRDIFNGKVNFYVATAIKIADVLGYVIVVKNEKWHIKLNSQTALTWWAQESIQAAKISVNKFKDKIGMSRVAVTANLKGESKMRINTLFKWAEITGYQVEVWQK